jgi:ADP-ribose pyrophosphatase YjhB (NUDIX family)
MAQMYKVFINDNPILLSSDKEILGGLERINFDAQFDFLNLKSELENSTDRSIHLVCEEVEEAWNKIAHNFEIIEAAGGMVYNAKKELLVIFRLGKWDLPKGKCEEGETIEESAIREVEEECGISKLKILRPLPDTYHTYNLKGRSLLKRTYWFEMECTDDAELIPQAEEGITGVEWITRAEWDKVLKNTYASIAELMQGQKG